VSSPTFNTKHQQPHANDWAAGLNSRKTVTLSQSRRKATAAIQARRSRIERATAHSPAEILLKRTLDVVVSSAALVGLAPLLAMIAALVRLDSSGPALYAGLRAGLNAKPFPCYKFRTMVRDADELKNYLRKRNQRRGPCFKIANDPRITHVGRFLRRYSLDELPQFWNVLKGDMSLVGPRPHPLDDFAAYDVEHLPRLDVTPGITGLWQVTARRDPSFQKSMKLDLKYIRTWSFGMDLRILFKTFAVVLNGSGD